MPIRKDLSPETLAATAAQIREKTKVLRGMQQREELSNERKAIVREIRALQRDVIDFGATELLVLSITAMKILGGMTNDTLHTFFEAFAHALDKAAQGAEKPEAFFESYLLAHGGSLNVVRSVVRDAKRGLEA